MRHEEAGKIRPCVVLSVEEAHGVLGLVTVIPCTTNLLGEGLFRIALPPRERLKESSEAMVEQIRGVSQNRILERLGTVSGKEMERIEEGIRALLGL
jgi:mRNA interferase MazF